MVNAGLPLSQVAMRLKEAQLLQGTHGPLDVVVSGVSQDSRDVSKGDLFLAWTGVDHDAHEFVAAAVDSGAVGAVVERPIPGLTVGQLQVSHGRRAGALAADEVMGSPWRHLFLAGVTGTNGKTTVASLARYLLEAKGPSRAIGTLGLVEEAGRVRPGTEGLTTPGPVRFSTWLRDMASEGVTHVTLEASSHALAQSRLDGTLMDAAVFTNLTQDHLDYHADLQEYRAAKGRLLELLKPAGWAIVNGDDLAWSPLSFPVGRTLFYGIEGGAGGLGVEGMDRDSTVLASDLQLLPNGSRFLLHMNGASANVTLPLLGGFNVENALAAACIARVGGMTLDQIAQGLSQAPQIPGRLEMVAQDPIAVLIDFAHTADALESVLRALRPVVKGRMLVVFGAGGDRDKGKRPLMGEVVARLSDLAFVTSDNPRTEDPEAIIDDVVEGMKGAAYLRFADRKEAIGAALAEARPNDFLVLAGKGHETYQVVGLEKLPFDERTIVREFLARGAGEGPV
jgi:UDP-N-acetylmuramoyl-L-alanyl-D-glutamate--2,6-diaminopimelate ligase